MQARTAENRLQIINFKLDRITNLLIKLFLAYEKRVFCSQGGAL